VYAALLAVVVVACTALAVVSFTNLGNPPIEGRQVAFDVLDDSSVRISFEVARDQPERPGVCIVRSRSRDGDETGRREVLVPPGQERTVVVTTVLRTSKRPVTGEVFGCSYQVPAYLSSQLRPDR